MDDRAERNSGAASTRARTRERRHGPRGGRLPDRVSVACPTGTQERIEEAAAGDGMTPAEWLRQTVRLALDAARKRREWA